MARAVGAVDALSDTIVGAIREQGAAGRVISASVADASIATDHIGANVTEIMTGARTAGDEAATMRDMARTLTARADALNGHLRGFLTTLHAA